jgi:hypothetical protein
MGKSVLFGRSSDYYVAKNPRKGGFDELIEGYDTGRRPACAINNDSWVVTVHQGASAPYSLYNRVWLVEEGIDFRVRDEAHAKFADGNNPSVALTGDDVVVAFFDQDNSLHYVIGALDRDTRVVTFGTAVDLASHDANGNAQAAVHPSVAIDKDGRVLLLHQSGGNVHWRLGTVAGTTLTLPATSTQLVANGINPSVSLNNKDLAVAVFQRTGGVFHSIGTISGSTISWVTGSTRFDIGREPTVALTDGGHVFALFDRNNENLFQRVGSLEKRARGSANFDAIVWDDFLEPETQAYLVEKRGYNAHVAWNGKVAVHVHERGVQLFGNACLFFDRASWMGDHQGELKDKTLRAIALPASHDAGAFAANKARTQGFNLRGQLRAGSRYFDVRPRYIASEGKFYTYHDLPAGQIFNGPDFAAVIANLGTFMTNHKELVILKISHFLDFDADAFAKLRAILVDPTNRLDRFLFDPGQSTTRLADRPLGDYLKQRRGTVLVVVDVDTSDQENVVDYVKDEDRAAGIFRYRDWGAADPQKGDLTVYDLFEDSPNFDTVTTNQLAKFEAFDGVCKNKDADGKDVQCDLFLLSWTLTPQGTATIDSAFEVSDTINGNLVQYLAIPAYAGSNDRGRAMNLLYTDAVETARSADVAMVRNDLV